MCKVQSLIARLLPIKSTFAGGKLFPLNKKFYLFFSEVAF